jgi:hypothetical protein
MIIVTVGLAWQVELPVAGGYAWAGVLWLIVADHDCIYWLYLYGPDLLYPHLPITPYHESCHFQASVNAWAGVLLYFKVHSIVKHNI